MESPFTGRKMTLVSTLKSKDRFYLCPDTKALFFTNNITKFDIQESMKLMKKLLTNIKA